MKKTAQQPSGGPRSGEKFMFRLSGELLNRLRLAADLRGMEVSEYLRKAATDALNSDTTFVKDHGQTAYLGANPAQVEKFLQAPLGREEIYFGNQRRMDAGISIKILAARLASLEKSIKGSKRSDGAKDDLGLPIPLDI
jgi:hypothetical protein